jgi:long-chain acyl-CoA synthetase
MESFYETRPWLKNYPDDVPHDLRLKDETAIGDFRKTTRAKPAAPAIYYFDHAITFEELDRFSDQLAVAFEDLGLKKGDRIVVDLQNVPQFPMAVFAAWKMGAIAVPVNPMYKEKELQYFCMDSGARLLLTHDEIAANLDLSFLDDTAIEKVIITSPLDFIPTTLLCRSC